MGLLLVFTLAGFLSAYVGSAYHTWVENLYAENSQSARVAKCIHDCKAHAVPGVDCMGSCEVSAYEAWYQQNVALSKYADRQWWLWGLLFPSAMTLAIVVSTRFGWLPHLTGSQILKGTVLLFVASFGAVVILLLLTFLWLLAFLPALVVCTYLLTRAHAVFTNNNPGREQGSGRRIFGLLLLCIPAGMILGGVLHLFLPNFFWLAGIQVAWGFAFGASLARPDP